MGSRSGRRPVVRRRRRVARSTVAIVAGVAAVAAAGLVAAVVWWSGATLGADSVALARVDLQPLGGSLVTARAFGPDGSTIPLSTKAGRLLPRKLLTPGESVTVVVVVRRPTWLGWALGHTRTERLTVRAPLPRLSQRWLTVAAHAPLRLRFADPVDRVSYRAGSRRELVSVDGRRVVSLGPRTSSGTLEVSSAPRSWERLSAPVRVTWFPRSRLPAVLVSPTAAVPISPRASIRLTFSRPLDEAVGETRPHFSSRVPGRWSASDSHTLVFSPTGYGFPLASSLRLELPHPVSVVHGDSLATTARTIDWNVAGASFLRLQQLLADAGYLPLTWQAAGTPPARRLLAQISAAVDPPAGRFRWRYRDTPPELQRLWVLGQPNQIIRGAVMMFEQTHGLAVDGSAGPQVWHALLADAITGTKRTDGYSYVYVHRNVPQLLTLWHNGRTVLTSPGNTGVPAAPTQLGSYPVFEHIPIGTMSGTNPDGSHYNDPGIRWISYFHGGDALHSFTRASFGTPQSLGCVELPLATAARVWPYTPIGTLVTIEN
jgi:peptidoglycan hydrolase-like protein with peptidoglycan-binding domain